MANAQTTQNPASSGYQVAAASVNDGNAIAPVGDTLRESRPHTQHEVSHPVESGSSAPNAGLGAQSIDGGTILEDKKRAKSKCILQ